MEKNEYFIYFSQKDETAAAKNISLEIKAKFKTNPCFIFILFTSDYNPKNLLQTFKFTLKNPNIFGIQAPCLIYQNKIIENGIISCCINKKNAKIDNLFIGSRDSEKIEYTLKSHFKDTKRKNIRLISFLSPQMNSSSFLEGLNRSLGKLVNFSGGGYQHKYSPYQQFMLDQGIGNGLVNLNFEKINTAFSRLHNFIPFGKPFEITRINQRQQIIYEINNQPAINIYKHFFEEKFQIFIKNRLFQYYPLGIPHKNDFRLLTILDILEDGSFLFQGTLKNKEKGNLMTLKKIYSKDKLNNKLNEIKDDDNGLIFIINSLSRKKILGEKSLEEIKNINNFFYPKKEMFGIYADYYLFPNSETQDATVETGGLLLNAWT